MNTTHTHTCTSLLARLLPPLAPMLLHVKPSVLLQIRGAPGLPDSVACALFCHHRRAILTALRAHCQVLKHGRNALLTLFYHPPRLARHLAHPPHAAFLSRHGYPPGAELPELIRRCRFAPSFPHEIGLFLGYPLKDVHGFITDPSTCLHLPRGLWRVTGDPAESLAAMARIRHAEDLARASLARGEPLPSVLHKLHLAAPAA